MQAGGLRQLANTAEIASKQAAKIVGVLARPSQWWRFDLYRVRTLIEQQALGNSTREIDTLLDKLLVTSETYPAALFPTYEQLRKVRKARMGLQAADRVWDTGNKESAEHAFACARVWYSNGQYPRADAAITLAKSLAPNWLDLYVEEASIQEARANSNAAVEAALKALELSKSHTEKQHWLRFLGVQSFLLRRYSSCVDYLLKSDLSSSDHEAHFYIALSFSRLGNAAAAEVHFVQSEMLPEIANVPQASRRGALFLHMGFPQLAASATQGVARPEDPTNVQFRALVASARYRELIDFSNDYDDSFALEARALASELSGDPTTAVSTYVELLSGNKVQRTKVNAITKRLVRSAIEAGDLSTAIEATLLTTHESWYRSIWHAEPDSEFQGALATVLEARANESISDAHDAVLKLAMSASSLSNYRRAQTLLGESFAAMGEQDRAVEAFQAALPFPLPSEDELSDTTEQLTYTELYSAALQTLSVNTRTIFYETYHGSKTGCNPLAICLGLLEREEFSSFHHVWAVKDDTEIHPALLNHPNVHFVRFESFGYRMHLATAAFLVNNVTFPLYFVRRDEQRYMNTWHGVPWKHLGRDFAENRLSFFNIARNLIQSTVLALPDHHTANKLLETQDISRLALPEPAIIGSPRVDMSLRMSVTRRAEVLSALSADPARPTVFYAPTWRSSGAVVSADLTSMTEAIQTIARQDVNVLVRVHHIVETGLKEATLPSNVIVAPGTVDTNELLGASDILISDYSSLIFDFAALSKPILKYIFDVEEYISERGLYFSVDEVPGVNCADLESLTRELEKAMAGPSTVSWADSPTSSTWAFEDGKATERAIEQLFGSPPNVREQSKPAVLVTTGGFNPSGITRSLRNLFSTAEDSPFALQLAASRPPLLNPNVSETVVELHQVADFSVLTGLQTGTRQELIQRERWMDAREPIATETIDQLRPLFVRERIRHFGHIKFQAAVDFEGYTPSNAALVALGFPEETPRIFVIHSEFAREMETRFPRLRATASILRHFSSVASVSSAVRQENIDRLGKEFSIPERLFSELPNTINVNEIRTKSLEPIDPDIAAWFDRPGPHAVALGRLSVEKNLSAAITALHDAHRGGARVNFLIIGDGNQRTALESLVASLELTEFVFFAGQRGNPYPAVRRADALIMSSIYEGQPMVLLEALTLNTPVIATSIPATDAVLNHGERGVLVPSGHQGLINAWAKIAAGELSNYEFAPEQYQLSALQKFKDLIQS